MKIDPNPQVSNPKQVVVIGAGITGAMLSYKLLLAGHRVTCVEAEHIASGSSARSAACVRAQWGTETNVRAMRRSIQFYAKLSRILGCQEVQMIRQNGYLYPCFDEESLNVRRGLYELQRQAGLEEVEFLDGKELHERFPHVNKEVLGGTFCGIDGFCEPQKICQVIFDWCKVDPGFELLQHARVIGVDRQRNKASAVVTPQGRIGGDVFVNATNAWAPRVAALFHDEDEKRRWAIPIHPEKRVLHFLEKGGWHQKQFDALPMTIFPSGAYCRPFTGDLMIGWEEELPPEHHFSHSDQDVVPSGYGHEDPDSHGSRTWVEVARWSEVIGRLPGIKATSSGYYGITPDRHHVIDYDLFVENLIHVAGCSGHGVMSAPFNADVVTYLVAVGRGVDVMYLNDEEFSLLPFASDPIRRTGIIDPTHL